MENLKVKGRIWIETSTGLKTEEGKKIVKMFREINECFKQFSEDESGRFSGWEK